MNQNHFGVVESGHKPLKEDAALRWGKLLEDQRDSGLSVSAYCRERGLSAASLFAWRRRLGLGPPQRLRRGAEHFKPVKLVAESKPRSADDQDPVAIELRLPGERRLIVRRGFDRELLLDLLDALEDKPWALEDKPWALESRS
jgi:hypothetical protein